MSGPTVVGAYRGTATTSTVVMKDGLQPTLTPPDLRVANLLRIIQELRARGGVSRSELARRSGLAVPTVHRLVSELMQAGFVVEDTLPADGARLGRPPVMYRFNDHACVVAAVDVGNATTRYALASASGTVLVSSAADTRPTREGLARSMEKELTGLLRKHHLSVGELAAVGVGIASAVDPRSGSLSNPPEHGDWHGFNLGDHLRRRFGCEVAVVQDDHLAAMAECSSAGTAPGAQSLLLIEVGKGIGVGWAVNGRSVAGTRGRFGRIANWPVTDVPPGGRPDATLAECLTVDGLMAQYRARRGKRVLGDGAGLIAAASAGDRKALQVVAWAATEIAAILARLCAVIDPDAVVFGGGLSRAFPVLEPHLRAKLPDEIDVLSSTLADQAVLVGAALAATRFVESWLSARLLRPEAPRQV